MRNTLVGLALICMCVMLLNHVPVNSTYAAIDADTAMGIWLMDEGQGDVIKDISGNGNDGNIVGAEWTEGIFGKGLEFDGTSHVEIPATETTDDYLDGFTYLLWVKPTGSPPNANTRLMERDWHNPTIQISNVGNFYVSTVVGGVLDNSAIVGGAWEIDQWSFVALTYNGSTLALYVDGEMIGELNVDEPDVTKNNANGAIWLGTWKAPGWDFKGVIDEVAAFNVALSEEDLNAIMNDGLENMSAVSSIGKMAITWGSVREH